MHLKLILFFPQSTHIAQAPQWYGNVEIKTLYDVWMDLWTELIASHMHVRSKACTPRIGILDYATFFTLMDSCVLQPLE